MVLWNDILDHEKAFNDYVHFVSAGDAESAIKTARMLLESIQGTLNKIQEDYARLVITARIPTYWEDRQKFDKDAAAPPSLAELAILTRHLQNYVGFVEREIKRMRPEAPPRWLTVPIQYKRQIGIGAAAAFGLFIVTWSVIAFVNRNHGLLGQYFSDMELSEPYRNRRDSEIDFNWNKESPFSGWLKDKFSVRWSGYIYIPKTDRYEFYTHSDDGARLYIRDELVIDDWKAHKVRVKKKAIDLVTGYYPIQLEYFERKLSATIKLMWKHSGTPHPEVVPSGNLVPQRKYLPAKFRYVGGGADADAEGEDEENSEDPSSDDEEEPESSEEG